MQKQFFFLSPVEVVKVTTQNLEEVAEWCGGSVQETESRRHPGRMDKYVHVPTPENTKISWAFPGMFITKRLVLNVKDELRATFAVFRRDYFEKNYFESPKQAVDRTWEREHAEKQKPLVKAPEVVVNVGQALIDAQKQLTAARDAAIEAGVPEAELEQILADKNFEANQQIEEKIADALDAVNESRVTA